MIELTEQQLQALEHPEATPPRVRNPRTNETCVLLRVEEYEQVHRDQWGCWEHGFSENFWNGRLWVPEVDMWVLERERELSGRYHLAPRWPEGHRFAVCLTHDVDMVSREQSTAHRGPDRHCTSSRAIGRICRMDGRNPRWRLGQNRREDDRTK